MSSNADPQPFSLFVATPSLRGSFCKPYVLGVVQVQNHCLRHGIDFELRVAQGISAIEAARNALANWFLFNSDATHMLFWDDDMGAVTDDLVRMFDYAERDVVAALYPRKRIDMARIKQAVLNDPQIDPALLNQIGGDFSGMFQPQDVQWATDEPIRLDRVGTGLMMISRRCLMSLVQSGAVSWSEEPAIAGGRMYHFFRHISREGVVIGEDFYFCDLVRSHGGGVWGCAWVRSVHVGQIEVAGNLRAVSSVGIHDL
ncbi:hypothetical protein [Lysobacter arvi]|uniref:Glycosyltransferase n=1 Tax=Lysobacter arvi TaxID=3038776 RepID=A0ABU1CDJ6_9GAMM|nr:hypothetical protein [Lysobacter arvi]MDR0183263.1 hypothetical protein [Lysobacter arvi]